MKKTSLMLLLLALFSVAVSAQIRGKDITISVTPSHADWLYKVGETAEFVVEVRKSGTLLPNVKISYEAGPAMYSTQKGADVALKDGSWKWKGKLTKPGFYALKVKSTIDGRHYEGLCQVGFSPLEIKAHTNEPKDFDAFWAKAVADARKVGLDPHRRLLPERCTESVNVYEVDFCNDDANRRVYGILCVPVKPGRYPALLRVPGAGVRPYGGDVYIASKGAITLEIGIHAISVVMPQKIYDDLGNGALRNYWNSNLASPADNYYKHVVTGAVRAADFLCAMPEWNGMSLGVTGASQGGFLSLATAALDKRVTFYAPIHPALCDHLAALSGDAPGWPHYFYWNKNATKEQLAGSLYYDGVNFARRITANGWFSFGYNDEVVCPSTSYAAFNTVGGHKEVRPYPLTGHYWYQEQYDEWNKWLISQMGLEE